MNPSKTAAHRFLFVSAFKFELNNVFNLNWNFPAGPKNLSESPAGRLPKSVFVPAAPGPRGGEVTKTLSVINPAELWCKSSVVGLAPGQPRIICNHD